MTLAATAAALAPIELALPIPAAAESGDGVPFDDTVKEDGVPVGTGNMLRRRLAVALPMAVLGRWGRDRRDGLLSSPATAAEGVDGEDGELLMLILGFLGPSELLGGVLSLTLTQSPAPAVSLAIIVGVAEARRPPRELEGPPGIRV